MVKNGHFGQIFEFIVGGEFFFLFPKMASCSTNLQLWNPFSITARDKIFEYTNEYTESPKYT